MSSSVSGKVVLITGGTKGIGASTARALHAQGALLSLIYSSDTAAAQSLQSSLGGPDRAHIVQADAASLPDIDRTVSTTVDKFGRIDILIPCAGVLPMKDLDHTSEADFDSTYALNVKGPYFLAQKAVPHMPQGGRIVFFSTSLCNATTVGPPYLLYCSTKGAIEQMVRVLSKTLAPKGILVNAVSPGPTGTELFLKGKSEAMLKGIASANPFGRIGEPDEVAPAVVFLCGEGAKWVDGQVLRVNGGWVV